MANKNSPISWLRRLSGTMEKIIEAVEAQGGTFNDLLLFLRSSNNCRILGMLVMGTLDVMKQMEYPVTIDYGMTFEEMLPNDDQGLGVMYDTTGQAPVEGKGVLAVTLKLVQFDHAVSSYDAIAKITEMGLRPAKAEELLAFAKTYPDIIGIYPLMALGTIWQDPTHTGKRDIVLSLTGDNDSGWLDHYLFHQSWPKGSWFLAAKE
jgi:hypothetical protein